MATPSGVVMPQYIHGVCAASPKAGYCALVIKEEQMSKIINVKGNRVRGNLRLCEVFRFLPYQKGEKAGDGLAAIDKNITNLEKQLTKKDKPLLDEPKAELVYSTKLNLDNLLDEMYGERAAPDFDDHA